MDRGCSTAGVALVEEGGYEALTIAAVCERADVPPRLIYERVSSKDALFLAVYEHGMQRVLADEAALDDGDRWAGLDGERARDRQRCASSPTCSCATSASSGRWC